MSGSSHSAQNTALAVRARTNAEDIRLIIKQGQIIQPTVELVEFMEAVAEALDTGPWATKLDAAAEPHLNEKGSRTFKISLKKRIRGERQSAKNTELWVERHGLLPFVPFKGLVVKDGVFNSGPILECYWDNELQSFIAITVEDYSSRNATKQLDDSAPDDTQASVLQCLKKYIQAGWQCCAPPAQDLKLAIEADRSLSKEFLCAIAEGAHALRQYAMDLDREVTITPSGPAARIISRRAENYREKALILTQWVHDSNEIKEQMGL